MTSDDQDRLLGQAMREKADLDKRLALIAYELERIMEGLTEIRNGLSVRSFAAQPSEPLTIPPAVSAYMDCSKLVDLLNEQSQLLGKRATVLRVIGNA